MHQGNWKCSDCGGTITELPFIPRSETGLTCRACYAKNKNGGSTPTPAPDTFAEEIPPAPDEAGLASEPSPDDGFGELSSGGSSEKPRFTGDWTCSGCGTSITSLPFTPRTTNNLKCLECFKQSKK